MQPGSTLREWLRSKLAPRRGHREDGAVSDARIGAQDDGARDAMRRSQKIARQLHQLLAASITVSGLRSEQEVLVRLAGSVRSVFDADRSLVTLDAGPASPLRIEADRDREPRSVSQGEWTEPMPAGPSTPVPFRDGEWLVAPMLVRRGESRGVVAVVRSGPPGFSDDDVEVLTLLAQMASSALDASEMNRTIQDSEERWHVLVEAAPIGIVETDLDGAILWWNRSAGTLFGWGAYPSRGEPAAFPTVALERLHEAWSELASGSDVVARDITGVELASGRRDLSASAAMLSSGAGLATSILTLVDDVTEHLQLLEDLRHAQRMEVIGQLSSSVAHDFNNLLTLITGYSELLTQEVDDQGRARQLVEDILATTTRASTLTGKLLTMGRTKTPAPTVFSPSGVIGSVEEVLSRIVGPGIRLTLSLDGGAGNVKVDPDQFEQTILNLAINARDAMPEGGELRISAAAKRLDRQGAREHALAEGDYVQILVADTGEGMDEETRLRCFDPLFTTKGPSKGTGLGLPAARRVVTEGGGAITCTSSIGDGTTFEILLPSLAEPATEGETAPSPSPERDTGTVLLAEDEEGIRRLVSKVLSTHGFDVHEANSGESALEVARSLGRPIDLLVSDVVMGGMTGRELAVALQAEQRDLLVVLVSGNVDSSVLEDLTPGSGAFLAKPFRPSELIEVVKDLRARSVSSGRDPSG